MIFHAFLLLTCVFLEFSPAYMESSKGPEVEQLKCYTCKVDFSVENYSLDNECINPKDTNSQSICSPNSNYCQTEITLVGGQISTFERRCVENCFPLCTERGFGIEKSTCISCCKNNPACGPEEY
ncbi:uncharacterized protein LOC106464102 [Limulus polyphemus]|uniref:Uncharacterized protein LOC106464102 n=1 Tax=Limulus polyphemus TaxID=6850 RepID=A0ABM1BDA4_LIMPO|nr:uncharacterized protein LOC106464102 [Limulus polyphemus]